MLICALNLVGLDRAPIFVGGDEAHFATHAESLATTGRDLNGRRWPLFILITDPLVPNNSSDIWYQPLLFYLLVPVFKIFPVSEWSLRLPTVLIAMLNVALVYLVGCRLFSRRRSAWIAAFLLALTPAHVIMSRQALDYICPVPFMLGWLYFLLVYRDTRRIRSLAAAGLCLGLGLFSYIAAWALMPMFLGITLVSLAVSRASPKSFLALLGGFGAPLLLFIPWLSLHPEMFRQTLARYGLAGAGPAGPAAAAVHEATTLAEQVTLYWEYFNPSFLFFAGGSNPTQATAQAGVFLLPVAVFLGCGLLRLLHRRSTLDLVLVAALFAAPLPIVLALARAPESSIARALVLLPLVALVAAHGIEWLLEQQSWILRAATAALLLAVPVQFGMFVDNYFTEYQLRAGPRLDPLNARDVAAFVLARDAADRVPAFYLRDDLDDRSVRWKFLMLKHGRLDLWQRTAPLNPERFDFSMVAPKSLLVFYAADPAIDRLMAAGGYSRAATIAAPGGEAVTAILQREP